MKNILKALNPGLLRSDHLQHWEIEINIGTSREDECGDLLHFQLIFDGVTPLHLQKAESDNCWHAGLLTRKGNSFEDKSLRKNYSMGYFNLPLLFSSSFLKINTNQPNLKSYLCIIALCENPCPFSLIMELREWLLCHVMPRSNSSAWQKQDFLQRTWQNLICSGCFLFIFCSVWFFSLNPWWRNVMNPLWAIKTKPQTKRGEAEES